MRWSLILASCLLATTGTVAAQSKSSEYHPMRKPLALGQVLPSALKIGMYEKLELRVDLAASYANPFDPAEVRLEAVFRAPSGKELTVPGFFLVPQKRTIEKGRESMRPTGEGFWAIRFAPSEIGRYTWRLKVKDVSGEISGGEGSFEAVAGDNPGFLRQSKVDPHYFAFDRGQGYFPIGHNVPIYHVRGQLGDEVMRKLAGAGENYNRWWMSAGGFGIEWLDRLGWYRQDAAARIDLVLDQARRLGLYFMMCMDTHQDFRERGWDRNPFNVRNGGPCRTPAEWFTNETGVRHGPPLRTLNGLRSQPRSRKSWGTCRLSSTVSHGPCVGYRPRTLPAGNWTGSFSPSARATRLPLLWPVGGSKSETVASCPPRTATVRVATATLRRPYAIISGYSNATVRSLFDAFLNRTRYST